MDTKTQQAPASVDHFAELLDKLSTLDADKIKRAAEAEEQALIKTIEPDPELLNPNVPDFESGDLNMSAAGFPVTFDMLFEAYMDREPIYLAGPTGGGKTTIGKALVDRANAEDLAFNRKVLAENLQKLKAGVPADQLGGYRTPKYVLKTLQGHEETRSVDLIGDTTLSYDEQNRRRIEAVLGAALESAVEGFTFLADESDSIAPGVYAQCHGLFDRQCKRMSFWLNGRKDFVKHPESRIIFTGNTKGEDENSLEYAHAQAQSKALMNRIAYVVDVDYMKPASEVALLKSRLQGLDEWIIKRMVACANNVRKLYKQRSISLGISTREVEAWGRDIMRRVRCGASAQDDQEFWVKVAVPAAGPTVLNKTSNTGHSQAAAREFGWR